MILLFSGLRGLIEEVTIVLTRDIRDLKFDINIDLWLKSYLSQETDIWFIKLIFEPWNFNWHPIPELQILSDDWHLIFGNAFWLLWRALLVLLRANWFFFGSILFGQLPSSTRSDSIILFGIFWAWHPISGLWNWYLSHDILTNIWYLCKFEVGGSLWM